MRPGKNPPPSPLLTFPHGFQPSRTSQSPSLQLSYKASQQCCWAGKLGTQPNPAPRTGRRTVAAAYWSARLPARPSLTIAAAYWSVLYNARRSLAEAAAGRRERVSKGGSVGRFCNRDHPGPFRSWLYPGRRPSACATALAYLEG